MTRICKNCCILLISFMLLLCSLSGCEKQGEQPAYTLRIGVAVYSQSDTFISGLIQELEQLAQSREEVGDVKINLAIMDGEGSQVTQNEQIDRLLALEYDVLCVNIVDRTSAAVLIDKAREKDTPILFFNREPVEEDIRRWDKVYYVGAKAEESGELQGELLVEAWQDDTATVDKNKDGVLQYVMLEGEPSHQDATLRTEYSIATLTENGVPLEKLAADTANWEKGEAQAKMNSWLWDLDQLPEAVICNNDDMALGALEAYKERKVPKEEWPVIIGVDATEAALDAVKAGELLGTVRNDATGIAENLLRLSLELSGVEEEKLVSSLEEPYIWLPYQKITKEDLEEKKDL